MYEAGMKLWEAQQVLCRYTPEAIVHVKLPEGRFVPLDHLEDHYPRTDEPCTCDPDPDESDAKVVDLDCPQHGPVARPRCPAFVTGDSHSPEVFHQAEEAECAHTVLDDMGIPREEESPREEGELYSLVGRITAALDKVRKSTKYEYETTSRKCEHEGTDKAKIPVAPEGSGWDLVSASCSGNNFWYFWRRLAV